MERRLILTGPSGCGKSSMIRESLGDCLAQAGGFITELAAQADGSLAGLELLPTAAVAGVSGYLPRRVLDFTRNPPKTDNEVYRSYGVQLLEEAAWYPFSLLDEFGGFELIIPQFREALFRFLSSELPCVGILKDAQEAELMRSWLRLGEKYTGFYRQLRDALSDDPDTLLLEIDDPGDADAHRLLVQWIAEYAR